MSTEQTQKLAAMVQRAAQCMPDYYASWHKDAREVLANLDSPQAPPPPRAVIQIASSATSNSNGTLYALCNDGTILLRDRFGSKWVTLPAIPQPGES